MTGDRWESLRGRVELGKDTNAHVVSELLAERDRLAERVERLRGVMEANSDPKCSCITCSDLRRVLWEDDEAAG